MSSTARGGVRSVSDFYQTPNYIVNNIIEHLNVSTDIFTGYKEILDPCAGGSPENPMAYVKVLREYGFNPDSLDIRKDSLAEIKGNFLEFTPEKEYDIIISNPPFALAQEFIEKSLDIVKDGGYVIMLLRLNFFESVKRKAFFDKQMPKYSLVHHKRISFTPDGKTDSICYQHCIWQKGYFPSYTKLKVI
jgi:hypothetical protein